MERKGRTTIRRQRRSRSWLFSPIVIAQLAVVMVLAGVGMAFAFDQTDISTNNAAVPWAGKATVDDSQYLSVTSYELDYDATLTKVTGVYVTIANTKGSTINADIKIAILDDDATPNLEADGSLTAQAVPTTGATILVPLDGTPASEVSITEVNTLNIIVTE